MFVQRLLGKCSPWKRSAKRSRNRLALPLNWTRLGLEALEARLVPSCNPTVDQFGELHSGCDNAANTFTLNHSGSTTITTYTGGSRNFADSTFNTIRIAMGTSADVVNILATVKLVFVTGGGGLDNVYLNANVGGIQARVDVSNPPSGGYTALTVDAAAVPFAYTVTLSEGTISFGGVPINYEQGDLRSLTLLGGTAANTYNITNTPESGFAGGVLTTIRGGASADAMHVLHTTGRLAIDGGGGLDDVNINANVGGISAPVDVTNPPSGGYTALTVDAAAVPFAYTVTLSEGTISFGGVPINYEQGDLRSLTLLGGTAANTYNITNTPESGFAGGVLTTINGGAGVNTFFIEATAAGSTTNLNGSTGNEFVLDNTDGTLNAIQGNLNLSGSGTNNFAVLHDEPNAMDQTYGFTTDTLTRTGLAPITYQNLTELVLYLGSGNNRVVWQSTAVSPFLELANVEGGNATLVGPDGATNLWQLVDGVNDELFVNGNVGVVFAGVSNLVGGSGGNTFQFSDGYQLSGSIDGGLGGSNTLDYTAYSTGVDVNLQNGTATGVAGGIANIQNVTGSQGDNILVGNGGNVLTVYGGHNLVIAGGGAGTLNGGTGLNILIGGYTDYDTDDASLQAILQFWEGVTSDNYDNSVNDLLAGNGVPALNTDTVHSNGGGNQFTGGALNLYFGSLTLDSFDTDPPNGRVIEM